MTWITVATPSFSSLDEIDAVLSEIGTPPDGMEARYIGKAQDGGLRVISLWESKTHAERFFTEKLGPTLAKVLGPEPAGVSEVVGIDVARTYER